MSFRAKKFNAFISPECEIKVKISREVPTLRDDGTNVIEVHTDIVDACDPQNFPTLPDVDEFAISRLLEAGVPLEQVNVMGILSDPKTDLANANAVIQSLDNYNKSEK